MSYLHRKTGSAAYGILEKQFVGQLRFFISGVILLFYYDFIKKHLKYFLTLSIVVVLSRYFISHWIIESLFPISFAIIIILFAYSTTKLANITKYGDFSYGFYLFHYPVIQVFVYLGIFKENLNLLFLLCFVIIFCLSFLSWHLLEKRVLKRK
jgi:peptidoglycan/LPS O-acetylase OafA/YrhL